MKKTILTAGQRFEKYCIITMIFGVLHVTYLYNGDNKMSIENKFEKIHKHEEKKVKYVKHL